MALSLRKPPKIKRNDYRRLRQNHSRNNGNEFIFTDDATNDELCNVQILDVPVPRHRLFQKQNDQSHEETTFSNDNRAPQSFLTYELQPHDTLQGVALKYGCTVAEIKRFNNLIQDQDVYALRELRIPAREHSVLFEIFSSASASSTEKNNSKTFHISIGQMLQKNNRDEPNLFLEEMDRDIQRMVEHSEIQPESSSLEKEIALSSPCIQPLVKANYDGANWGINWYGLLVMLLVVSVLAPVVYGIYFVTMVHNSNETIHNHTTETNS